MLDATSKALFHGLAQIPTLQRLASKYGMAPGSGFARRFIAGESIEEAVDAVAGSARQGPAPDARLPGRKRVERRGGVGGGRRLRADHRRDRRVRHRAQHLAQADAARASTSTAPRRSTTCGASSSRPMRTGSSCASTWRTRRTPTRRSRSSKRCGGRGTSNVGTVIQSYLKRSTDDVRRLNALGARVRLVKGAYKEPKNVAYQKKSEVDAAFVELMQLLLDEGTYPAIATHDPDMIDATKALREEQGLRERSLRVPDALRHPPRSADGAREGRLPGARLRAVRQAVVSVFHAPARRAAGQRRVRLEGNPQRQG